MSYSIYLNLEIADLTNDLIDLAPEWKALATQFNIPPATQNRIQGDKCPVENCLHAIIEEWLWHVPGQHTKKMLVEVLRKPALEENRLARVIENDKGNNMFQHYICSYDIIVHLFAII